MNNKTTVSEIADRVNKVLEMINTHVPVGISNRHVHLSQKDLNILFGEAYQLNVFKDLKQPGQFASQEKISLVGPRGKIDKVRILGPVRKQTQVEISVSDGFKLGIEPPVRASGDLIGSPSVTLVGPKGSVEIENGLIAAARHIHMGENDAVRMGIVDGEKVSIKKEGSRSMVLSNVTVRVHKNYKLELHLDMDEANAVLAKNGDLFEVLR